MREELLAAIDRTSINCLVCLVKPTHRCFICDDGCCDTHKPDWLLGCPICYAIQLVAQRRRLLDALRKI